MTWWIPSFLHFGSENDSGGGKKEARAFVLFHRAIRKAFYDNFVDTLYKILTVSTFAYLAASIVVFFFQKNLPQQLVYVIATFSEPYLGALGVYLVINELRRRAGKTAHPHIAAVFTGAWMALLVISTVLVVSHVFYFNTIYRIIVTNSLAALIIRIGSVLSKVP